MTKCVIVFTISIVHMHAVITCKYLNIYITYVYVRTYYIPMNKKAFSPFGRHLLV